MIHLHTILDAQCVLHTFYKMCTQIGIHCWTIYTVYNIQWYNWIIVYTVQCTVTVLQFYNWIIKPIKLLSKYISNCLLYFTLSMDTMFDIITVNFTHTHTHTLANRAQIIGDCEQIMWYVLCMLTKFWSTEVLKKLRNILFI